MDASAPGDTVAVAAGIYTEQVVVTTTRWCCWAPVVIRPWSRRPSTCPTGWDRRSARRDQRRVDAGRVTVRDLTIDGLGRQPRAAASWGCSTTAPAARSPSLAVRNIHPSPVSSSDSGIGILATLDCRPHPPPSSSTTPSSSASRSRAWSSRDRLPGRPHRPGDRPRRHRVGRGPERHRTGAGSPIATVADCEVRNLTYDGSPSPEVPAIGLLAYNSHHDRGARQPSRGCQTGAYLVPRPRR